MAIANITNNILTDSGVATSALQPTITLTTTGTSGAATLVGATLNIPNYGSALTGYVPYTGATADLVLGANKLKANSVYAEGSGGSGGALQIKQYAAAAINEIGYSSIGTLTNGYFYFTSSASVPNFKNFALNPSGLTDNTLRTYTLPDASGTLALTSDLTGGTVTSVAALTIGTTGTDLSSTVANSTTTPVITLNVPTASASNRGALSSTDWTTFNSKQNALTNPVTGTGTTNYLPKFTGASTIGNSAIFENGTNVGINTASPSNYTNLTTLTINGTNGSVIDLKTGNTLYGEIYSLANELRIDAVGASSVLKFLTNSVTRATIDASGNLGLGVTPSAWSGFTAMQVQTLGIWSAANDNYANFSSNSYFDGSNNRYISTQAATLYQQYRGNHYWFQASSGTAGNAISFTQAMTLTAAGRLLIGTPTEATYMLDVNGTGRFSGALTGTSASFIKSDNLTTAIGSFAANNLSQQTEIWYGGIRMGGTSANVDLNLAPKGTGVLSVTGAATFSSSVTAGGLVTINKINEGLILTAGANTDASYMSTRANNSTGWMIMGSQGTTAGYIQSGTAANESAITTVGAYALSLGTNQVERMRITSGGAVAINYTTAPNGKLYVNGGNDTDVIAIQNTLNTGAFLVFADNVTPTWANAPRLGAISNDMIFRTLATERMRITSGGNVLIGTTTDATGKLQVNGEIRMYGSTLFRGMSSNTLQLCGGTSSSNVKIDGSVEVITMDTNGATRLTIASTGAATFSSDILARSGTIDSRAFKIYEASAGRGGLYPYNLVTGSGTDYSSVGIFSEGEIFLASGGSVTKKLRIESGGAATFTSSVTATSFFESSDSRLKTLIQDNYQTKGIGEITPKLYTKNGKVELGYYAQDLVGVLDSAVSKGSDEMLSLSYREVHTAKIYALEQRIKELENK